MKTVALNTVSQRSQVLRWIAVATIWIAVYRVHEIFGPAFQSIPVGKLVLGGGLLYIATNRRSRQILEPLFSPAARWYWVYLAAIVLSLPLSVYRGGAFKKLVETLPAFLGVVVVVSAAVRNSRDLAAVVRAAVSGVAMIGIAATVGIGSYMEGGRTSVGLMYDPNDIALVALITLPLAMQTVREPELRWRALGIIGTISALLIIVRAGSRGGFIGAAVVLLVYLISPKSKLPIRWRVAVVVIGISATPLLPQAFYDRLSTFKNIENEYNFTAQIGRVQLAKRGFEIFLDHPLTGVGFGQFSFADGMRAQSQGVGEGFAWHQPHNVYVQVLAELGAFGFVGFLGVLLGNFHSGSRMRRAAATESIVAHDVHLALGVEMATLGFIVSGTFLTAAYSPSFLLICSLGIAVRSRVLGLGNRKRSRSRTAVGGAASMAALPPPLRNT